MDTDEITAVSMKTKASQARSELLESQLKSTLEAIAWAAKQGWNEAYLEVPHPLRNGIKKELRLRGFKVSFFLTPSGRTVVSW